MEVEMVKRLGHAVSAASTLGRLIDAFSPGSPCKPPSGEATYV